MKNDFVSVAAAMDGGGSHLTACRHDEVHGTDQAEAKAAQNQREEQKEGEAEATNVPQNHEKLQLADEESKPPKWAIWQTQVELPPEGEHRDSDLHQVQASYQTEKEDGYPKEVTSSNWTHQDQDSSLEEAKRMWKNKEQETERANIQMLVQLGTLMENSQLKEEVNKILNRDKMPKKAE